jgi:hypothetical protein
MFKIFLFILTQTTCIYTIKTHILNIEGGEQKVSQYLEDIKEYKFQTSTVEIKNFEKSLNNASDNQINLSEYIEDALITDNIPKIKFSHNNEPISFSLKTEGNSCLYFNYHLNVADSPITCEYNNSGKNIEIKENVDELYRADKIFPFDNFNIIFKDNQVFITEHDGIKFTAFLEVNRWLNILKDKSFIDVLTYENLFKEKFVLCHTKDEIFIFTVKKNQEEYMVNMAQIIDKSLAGINYHSISGFVFQDGNTAIAYSNEEISFAFIDFDNNIEIKNEIKDDDKVIKIKSAKFSTSGMHAYIVAKDLGFYVYDVMGGKVKAKLIHPHLTQVELLSRGKEDNLDYIGVYVDQSRKNIPEVLIELVYILEENSLNLNRVYTTNDFKFKSSLYASRSNYLLYTDDFLYMLPRAVPYEIYSIGARLPFNFAEHKAIQTISSLKGDFYAIKNFSKVDLMFDKEKKMVNTFSCKFTKPLSYDLNIVNYLSTEESGKKLNSLDVNINIKIEGENKPEPKPEPEPTTSSSSSTLIIVLCVILAVAAIVIFVVCFIRYKRRSNNNANNYAQVL